MNLAEDLIIVGSQLNKFLGVAKPLSLAIPRRRKHVSIIFDKNKIIAVGTNTMKGHPLAKSLGYRFEEQHSELNAYLKCKQRIGLSLLNVRYNEAGALRMARPCPLCLPWCKAIFDEIYYTCPLGQVRLLAQSTSVSPLKGNLSLAWA